jgi:ribosomal protein S27AE
MAQLVHSSKLVPTRPGRVDPELVQLVPPIQGTSTGRDEIDDQTGVNSSNPICRRCGSDRVVAGPFYDRQALRCYHCGWTNR